MNKKTLKALNESIEKWKRNVVAETPDDVKLGAHNCALCDMFNKDLANFLYNWHSNGDCDGCPVMNKTGNKYCDGTPYIKVLNACDGWFVADYNYIQNGLPRIGNVYKSATEYYYQAQKMVDFLESLLPAEDQK